ncbi:unnamed protein product [Ostreobium quekettii]|uniref:Uncharacterized protein n=1 Tax=Ostreobium quekettii TaxID=121088 RepID=A0A8S1IUZ0_9CHLO|nr:unnamed protein product [Ostreobium quekettii]
MEKWLLQEKRACSAHTHVVAAHGGVDVLVNNAAARARRGGGVLEGDPEEWDEMTAINLMAPMRLTRRLAPAMVARGGGLIINIASIASVDPLAYVSCYSATKFGLRGWSLCCHRSLREHGVKVVCVNPGVVRTGAVMSLPGFEAEHMMTPDDVAEACLLPLRTGGQCVPEEITLRNLHDAAPFMRESP